MLNREVIVSVKVTVPEDKEDKLKSSGKYEPLLILNAMWLCKSVCEINSPDMDGLGNAVVIC